MSPQQQQPQQRNNVSTNYSTTTPSSSSSSSSSSSLSISHNLSTASSLNHSTTTTNNINSNNVNNNINNNSNNNSNNNIDNNSNNNSSNNINNNINNNSNNNSSNNINNTNNSSNIIPPSIKCVLAGDERAGKTCLVTSYTRSKLVEASSSYAPTTFDNFAVDVSVEGKPIKVQLCDTSGRDELATLRSVWFSSTDVFLLCFNTADIQSFENIKTKWLPEVNACSPNRPIILVGLQTDRRDQQNQNNYVSVKMARECANSLPCCAGYVECCATVSDRTDESELEGNTNVTSNLQITDECSDHKQQQEVKEVFDQAIFAALHYQGFVKKRRGLSSIRCKKYKCKSELWSNNNNNSSTDDQFNNSNDNNSNNLIDRLSEQKNSLNCKNSSLIKSQKGYTLKNLFHCFIK